MARRVLLRPRAGRDLDDIWDFTAERWGVEQAERYARRLKVAIESLADRPDQGRAAPDIRPGYFRLTIGSHVAFYVKRSGHVEVVRVLHARMNHKARLRN